MQSAVIIVICVGGQNSVADFALMGVAVLSYGGKRIDFSNLLVLRNR